MEKHILTRSRAPRGANIYTNFDANVAKQFPLWGKGSVVRYWAERGLVHWEDSKDNSYGSMPWQEAAYRVLGLSQMVHNTRKQGLMGDEVNRMQKFVSDMEPVIKQAKTQGGPLDDMHDVAEERRRRRPKIMPMPANSSLEFAPARAAKKDPHKGVQRPNMPKAKPAAEVKKPRIVVP
jgi:hypothetical protein